MDSRLHDLVASSCGNAFLTAELGRLKILFRGLRDVSYTRHEERNDLRRLAEEAREHLAIVEAIAGRRPPRSGAGHVAAYSLGRQILEPGLAPSRGGGHEGYAPGK